MHLPLHGPDGGPRDPSRRLHGTSRLEALLDLERPGPDELQAARTAIAVSSAHLPIVPEMAWAVPQLLKRVQLVSPGTWSTSDVLRALIRRPDRDEPLAKAFADSGFLSCDRAIERARWKYDIGLMAARHQGGADFELMEHCRLILQDHRAKQPLDWKAVLLELQTLDEWFQELRTIGLLRRLYARLHVLHVKAVLVAQSWLEWRVGLAEDGGSNRPQFVSCRPSVDRARGSCGG
jgi:hypothetical protein